MEEEEEKKKENEKKRKEKNRKKDKKNRKEKKKKNDLFLLFACHASVLTTFRKTTQLTSGKRKTGQEQNLKSLLLPHSSTPPEELSWQRWAKRETRGTHLP